jgi:hypothetical protein
MIDLYLKAPTKADMDAALLAAELVYEVDNSLWAAPDILIDIIGPITKWDTSVEPPVKIVHPEWHVNVRAVLTDEQLAAVEPVVIIPPAVPYRVWA